MSLEPFLTAPIHIQFHAAAATLAVVIGPVALYRKRRDFAHKIVGYVWVIAMLTVAISAFFIHSFAVIGPFSPLHGFAILTLWSIWRAISSVRRGEIRTHELTLRSLYWFGLLAAGLANFLPDRRVNEAAFGGQDHLGFVAIGIGAILIGAVALSGLTKKPKQEVQYVT